MSEKKDIELVSFILERAADECHGMQMFPTMPVSAEYRKGYNDGVCEAAEDILKLESREILAEFKEAAKTEAKLARLRSIERRRQGI